MNLNIGAQTKAQMKKYEAHVDGIRPLGSAVIAFSGGLQRLHRGASRRGRRWERLPHGSREAAVRAEK